MTFCDQLYMLVSSSPSKSSIKECQRLVFPSLHVDLKRFQRVHRNAMQLMRRMACRTLTSG